MLRVLFIVSFLLLPFSACADTVEFIRGGKVNGAVTLKDDKFVIQADFAEGGKREITVERRFVSSVEISSNTANPGAAPANFGIFSAADAEHFELGTVDVLRLKDGERLRGRITALTSKSATINGEEIPRSEIIEALMGSAVLYR